jgi:hypothetical protein
MAIEITMEKAMDESEVFGGAGKLTRWRLASNGFARVAPSSLNWRFLAASSLLYKHLTPFYDHLLLRQLVLFCAAVDWRI